MATTPGGITCDGVGEYKTPQSSVVIPSPSPHSQRHFTYYEEHDGKDMDMATVLLTNWGRSLRPNVELSQGQEAEMHTTRKGNEVTDGAFITAEKKTKSLPQQFQDSLEALSSKEKPQVKTESDSVSSGSYSHHYYDDKFPGVCFLGEPLQYTVKSDPVTISPSGLAITIKIPSNAFPPGEYGISIQPCLSGPFDFPDGYEPLSAIYHISTSACFQKSFELELGHFGDVMTEEQASNMAFFRAKSSPVDVSAGKQKFKFSRAEGGEFAIGKSHGRISSEHFCFLAILGFKPKGKHYIVLNSRTVDYRHIAIAVSVDDPVFTKNFCKCIEKQFPGEIQHNSVANINFEDDVAYGSSVDPVYAKVEYSKHCNGWTITPNRSPCKIYKEDVDYSGPHIQSEILYPPRICFEMICLESALPWSNEFRLVGFNREMTFPFHLQNTHPPSMDEWPTILELMKFGIREINIIQGIGDKYHNFGIILLQDGDGSKMSALEREKRENAEDINNAVLIRWIRGEGRKPTSWALLATVLDECQLSTLADVIRFEKAMPGPS